MLTMMFVSVYVCGASECVCSCQCYGRLAVFLKKKYNCACVGVNKLSDLVEMFITVHRPYSFTGKYEYIAVTIKFKCKKNER